MLTLKEKIIIITGASRGIGLAIALKYAAAGANIVVLTKDSSAAIESTIEQIRTAGGQALAFNLDVSDNNVVSEAIDQAVARYGSVDVLVNNTSATCFTDTLNTSPEQFDLVIATSVRAAFFLSQACIPFLKKTSNPHIINIAPPIEIDPHLLKDYLAFSIAKYAMSLCTLGLAEELRSTGIAVNALWPQTTIATQTIKDHFSSQVYSSSRWPSIMADAAYELISRPSRECSGYFFTDESLLREAGVTDFSHYAVDQTQPLMQALFIPPAGDRIQVSQDMFLKRSGIQ